MSVTTEDLERGFAWLEARLSADSGLVGEHSTSLRQYFAHGTGAAPDTLAARRHLEWFLLERFSPGRGGTPIETLVHDGAEADEDAPQEALAALLGSLASVFEVTGLVPGEGVWVRDLAGGGEYALEEPEASRALEVSDLLVGRVFQVGPGLHRVSGAAGLFRDERLLSAVRHDLEAARSSRRGTLRLSQLDLERMFWPDSEEADAAAPTLAESLARAQVLLRAGGLDEAACQAIFDALRASSGQAFELLPGGGDTLGEVLERLAMESEVDLAAARAALLAVWTAFARDAGVPAPAEPLQAARRSAPLDAEAAMAAFDRGRAEGRDLEQLFRELERDLGLDEEDVDGEEDLAPDFPGVVAAMVEEYLWELERTQGSQAARAQAGLRAFGSFGASIGVFENLTRRDLLLFGSIWLPEYGQLDDEGEARALVDALEAFCAWCSENHDVELKREFDAELSKLRETLPRLVAARPWFSESAGPEAGSLWFVREVGESDATLVDAVGAELRVTADARLLAKLRPEDWLRGDVDAQGRLQAYCAYPPQSARLRPQAEA